jgi:condensin complex subunit 1
MELSIPSKFDDLFFDEAGEYGFNVSLEDASNNNDLLYSESLSDFVDTCKSISHSQLTNGSVNQQIFTLIKTFATLSDDCKLSLVEDLSELVKLGLDELVGKSLTDAAKINGKKTFFYFIQLIHKAEENMATGSNSSGGDKLAKGKTSKKKSGGEFNWSQGIRKKCLCTLKEIVTSEIGQYWTMGIIEESFLKNIWSYCVDLLVERPAGISGNGNVEIASRGLAIQILGSIVRHFGSITTSGSYCALATALLDGILRTEHMAGYVGEICHQEKVQSGQVGHAQPLAVTMELIAEISKMNLGLVSAQGVKNISSFIEAYSKADPESFSLFIPTMIKQVDSPAHQMRSAMILAMGHVIEYIREAISAPLPTGEEGDDKKVLSPGNRHALLRQRDDLLNILVERTHDINPYTRSSLLKGWAALVDSNAVPVKRMGSIAEVALDRLFDKNSFVRRSSLVLFTSLVDGNPFTGKLDIAVFEQQRGELEKLIEMRLQELSETMASKIAAEAEKAEQRKLKKGSDAEAEEEEETLDEDELFADAEADEIMVDLRAKHDYVSSATEFMKAIATALPRIASMLESKNVSDVIEALSFFGRAINFQVHGALEEFKNAFKLIWHSDASVRQEIQTVFVHVYLTVGDKEHPRLLPSSEIALNLAHVIATCDEAHLTSLEEIIAEITSRPSLPGFDTLPLDQWWNSLLDLGMHPPGNGLLSSSSSPISYLTASMHAISMMASRTHEQHHEVLVQSIPRLLSAGLGEETLSKRDLDTLRGTIIAVTRAYNLLQKRNMREQEQQSKKNSSLPVHLPSELLHDALISMQKVITWGAFLTDEISVQTWFGVCEVAVHAIFQLHETPEVVMDSIVHYMHQRLFGGCSEHQGDSEEEPGPILHRACTQSQLAAFLFILGQIAINTVVYVDDIAAKVKRRLRENIEAGKPATSSEGQQTSAGGENNISDFEEQMGVAAAVDAEHDQEVHHLIEKELVLSNLLGAFFPLVTYIAANEQRRFSAPVLRDAAVLTLCRYAAISSISCEQSLPLIFTILERSESQRSLRTTITVALGDLAFRFPNTFEPWTNHLYARLRDDDADVRYNTLVVITHLVLNDMIKVKGQVSHVAMALNDAETRVRDLARMFFIKLSERSNNPVFNLLGDIISHFSRDEMSEDNAMEAQLPSTLVMPSLSEEAFQQSMHFLLSFVQKEKHADSLLERLLIRLGAAETIRQRRYLGYCISELTVTEKGLKKLMEMIKTIKVALLDEDVFQHFRTMLARARKSRAPNATSGSTGGGNEDAAGSVLPAGVPSSVVSKSLVEEVEQAMLAAISGNEGGGNVGAGLPEVGEKGTDPSFAGDEEGGTEPKRTVGKKSPPKSKSVAPNRKGGKSGPKKNRTHKYDSDTDPEEEEDDDNDEEEEEEEGEEDLDEEEEVARVAAKREKRKVETRKPSNSRRGKQIQVDDEE